MPEPYDDRLRRLEKTIADLEITFERQSEAMLGRGLTRLYAEIKARRAEQLAWAIGVLEPKAAGDPELAEVLELLRQWAHGGENGREVQP